MEEVQELAHILIEQCSEAEESDLPEILKAFVQEISKADMLTLLPSIEEAIDSAWKQKFGISKVTVVSAHPLKDELQAQISQITKGADLVQRVDERLIGGAVIRIDDKRIDGTIAGKLRRLKMKLIAG